jgi:hypothetical protein
VVACIADLCLVFVYDHDAMAFRKVTNKGFRKFIGKFSSFIHKKIIAYESRLERDFLYLVEWDHLDVLGVWEQACRVHYFDNGRRRRFTIDFLIKRKRKTQMIEIKYSTRAEQPKHQAAFRAARKAANREGYEFKVYTEKTIRQQPRLDNIKLLIYYQRTIIHPQHQILCRDFFRSPSKAYLGELTHFFNSKGVETTTVFALLRWRVVGFDINQPLIPEAIVYLPGKDE